MAAPERVSLRTTRKCAAISRIIVKQELRARSKQVSLILKKPEDERQDDEKLILQQSPEIVISAIKRAKSRALSKERLQETEDAPEILLDKCQQLAKAIQQARSFIIFTGAGISTAASIPDYRGPNGVWTLLEKGIQPKFQDLSDAEPTLTHMAITQLYREGYVKHVVSQNCDGLHLRSGLPQHVLSEVHGNMYLELCHNCKPQREYLRLFDVTERTGVRRHKTGRKCHECGDELRDTIVHFGEKGGLKIPYNWQQAVDAVDEADVILCLGSSLKVLRKYGCLWSMHKPAAKRAKLFIVNLQWTPKDDTAKLKINGRCDDVMKIVLEELNHAIPSYTRERDPLFEYAIPLRSFEVKTTCKKILIPPSRRLWQPIDYHTLLNKKLKTKKRKQQAANYLRNKLGKSSKKPRISNNLKTLNKTNKSSKVRHKMKSGYDANLWNSDLGLIEELSTDCKPPIIMAAMEEKPNIEKQEVGADEAMVDYKPLPAAVYSEVKFDTGMSEVEQKPTDILLQEANVAQEINSMHRSSPAVLGVGAAADLESLVHPHMSPIATSSSSTLTVLASSSTTFSQVTSPSGNMNTSVNSQPGIQPPAAAPIDTSAILTFFLSDKLHTDLSKLSPLELEIAQYLINPPTLPVHLAELSAKLVEWYSIRNASSSVVPSGTVTPAAAASDQPVVQTASTCSLYTLSHPQTIDHSSQMSVQSAGPCSTSLLLQSGNNSTSGRVLQSDHQNVQPSVLPVSGGSATQMMLAQTCQNQQTAVKAGDLILPEPVLSSGYTIGNSCHPLPMSNVQKPSLQTNSHGLQPVAPPGVKVLQPTMILSDGQIVQQVVADPGAQVVQQKPLDVHVQQLTAHPSGHTDPTPSFTEGQYVQQSFVSPVGTNPLHLSVPSHSQEPKLTVPGQPDISPGSSVYAVQDQGLTAGHVSQPLPSSLSVNSSNNVASHSVSSVVDMPSNAQQMRGTASSRAVHGRAGKVSSRVRHGGCKTTPSLKHPSIASVLTEPLHVVYQDHSYAVSRIKLEKQLHDYMHTPRETPSKGQHSNHVASTKPCTAPMPPLLKVHSLKPFVATQQPNSAREIHSMPPALHPSPTPSVPKTVAAPKAKPSKSTIKKPSIDDVIMGVFGAMTSNVSNSPVQSPVAKLQQSQPPKSKKTKPATARVTSTQSAAFARDIRLGSMSNIDSDLANPQQVVGADSRGYQQMASHPGDAQAGVISGMQSYSGGISSQPPDMMAYPSPEQLQSPAYVLSPSSIASSLQQYPVSSLQNAPSVTVAATSAVPGDIAAQVSSSGLDTAMQLDMVNALLQYSEILAQGHDLSSVPQTVNQTSGLHGSSVQPTSQYVPASANTIPAYSNTNLTRVNYDVPPYVKTDGAALNMNSHFSPNKIRSSPFSSPREAVLNSISQALQVSCPAPAVVDSFGCTNLSTSVTSSAVGPSSHAVQADTGDVTKSTHSRTASQYLDTFLSKPFLHSKLGALQGGEGMPTVMQTVMRSLDSPMRHDRSVPPGNRGSQVCTTLPSSVVVSDAVPNREVYHDVSAANRTITQSFPHAAEIREFRVLAASSTAAAVEDAAKTSPRISDAAAQVSSVITTPAFTSSAPSSQSLTQLDSTTAASAVLSAQLHGHHSVPATTSLMPVPVTSVPILTSAACSAPLPHVSTQLTASLPAGMPQADSQRIPSTANATKKLSIRELPLASSVSESQAGSSTDTADESSHEDDGRGAAVQNEPSLEEVQKHNESNLTTAPGWFGKGLTLRKNRRKRLK